MSAGYIRAGGIRRRLGLRFDDAALEADWREAQRARAVPMVRRALVGLAILVVAGGVLQWALVELLGLDFARLDTEGGRQLASSMAGARGLAIVTAVVLPYIALATARGQRHPFVVATWVMTCMVAGLGVVTAMGAPPALAHRVGFIGAILLPANFFLFGMGLIGGLASIVPMLGALVAVVLLAPPAPEDLALIVTATIYILWMCGFGAHRLEVEARAAFASAREVTREKARADTLLRAILPDAIAERLKDGPGRIASAHAEVTVLFSDIVGFTRLSQTMPPEQLVALLHALFSGFDAAAERLGVEKIKTIGDAYMAVAGLPRSRPDHAAAAARLALEMLAEVEAFRARTGHPLSIRIGLHSGAVVAGVIGTTKFCYDLWGDTVNTAARMESHGVPGAVQVSAATAEALQAAGFTLTDRGTIAVKGKGDMQTWLLAEGADG